MRCEDDFQIVMQMGNKGAFIRFTAPHLKPDIVSFSAVVCIKFECHVCYFLNILKIDGSFPIYSHSLTLYKHMPQVQET